ncbi:MAG: TonB C-terminal domain-containing protein [Bdellovibrionota bacterium]
MKKIEAIKQRWKQLVLSKDKTPSEQTAPKDAKYMSDKNRSVEKEQRARNTSILPGSTTQSQPIEKSADRPTKQLNLGKFGIPLRMKQVAPYMQYAKGTQGDQYIHAPELPEGGENLLNTQESVYYSFYARMYEAIAPVWQSRVREISYQYRLKSGEYNTVVDIVLDRKGNVTAIRLLESSGVYELDYAVENSWFKIARFPNPPHGLLDNNDEVHTGWTFRVDIGNNAGFQFLPPERNY